MLFCRAGEYIHAAAPAGLGRLQGSLQRVESVHQKQYSRPPGALASTEATVMWQYDILTCTERNSKLKIVVVDKVREGAAGQLEEALALPGADAVAALERGGRLLAALQPGRRQGSRGARSGERESDRLGAAVRTSNCQHFTVNVEPEQGGKRHWRRQSTHPFEKCDDCRKKVFLL